jgi:hypothetical protein
MAEVWLRPNRRVLVLGMILPGIIFVIGLIHLWGARSEAKWALPQVGWALSIVGAIPLGLLISFSVRPRLAYQRGELLVYLRSNKPISVPVEYIECCFVATGAGQIPTAGSGQIPVRNLVLRVAERAKEFQNREVKRALGRWEDGYITINGAWCEPLTLAVAQRLNARLAELHQAQPLSAK